MREISEPLDELNKRQKRLVHGKHFEVRDHDQPTKYVFNGASRVAATTGSLSTNTRIQRLRLVLHGLIKNAVKLSRL